MRAPGEGSIFKRQRKRPDGSVRVVWTAQISSGPRGAQRMVTRTGRTKSEAVAKLAQLKADLRTNREPLTVGRFLESWVQETRGIRATTRRGYEAVVTIHLTPAIGHLQLAELAPGDVETMLVKLGPTMSPKTLRNIHGVLRRALQHAVRTGRVVRNVAAREFVDTPRVPTVEARVLTTPEIRRLIEVAKGDRIEALIITALGTGLRQGELLGLAWEDIGVDAITVRQELVYYPGAKRGEGKYRREDPKTERSKRRVPLSPAVAAALERQRARLTAEGFAPIKTGPVFTNARGQNLSGSWVTHHFYDLLVAAEIERLPFKNLRSTYSTRLFEAGISDRMIADLMGHTRTATTQKHYIASAGADQGPAIDAIEAMVG